MKRNKLYANDPKYQVYHSTIDRLMMQSDILNNHSKMLNATSRLYDEAGIKTELLSLRGNQTGDYYKGNDLYPSNVKICKAEISELKVKFESYCSQQVREGRKRPTEPTQAALNELLAIEARLYVYHSEVEELEKRLAPYLKDEQTIDDNKVLKNGPRGSAQLSGGRIVTMDNMKISINESGLPFINDPRAGQYNGYLTSDYLEHIVQKWAILKAQKAKQNMMEAQSQGIELDTISKGRRNGSNVAWPIMPSDCVNQLG